MSEAMKPILIQRYYQVKLDENVTVIICDRVYGDGTWEAFLLASTDELNPDDVIVVPNLATLSGLRWYLASGLKAYRTTLSLIRPPFGFLEGKGSLPEKEMEWIKVIVDNLAQSGSSDT